MNMSKFLRWDPDPLKPHDQIIYIQIGEWSEPRLNNVRSATQCLSFGEFITEVSPEHLPFIAPARMKEYADLPHDPRTPEGRVAMVDAFIQAGKGGVA